MGKERQIKRMRKEVRRQQKIWAESVIKPKPYRWIPSWLWMWFLKFFLKMGK